MGVAGWILLVGGPIALLLLTMQVRRESRSKASRGTASRVMRAGFLEVQGMLEPEKKVEILKQDKHEDLLIVLDPSGAPPKLPTKE